MPVDGGNRERREACAVLAGFARRENGDGEGRRKHAHGGNGRAGIAVRWGFISLAPGVRRGPVHGAGHEYAVRHHVIAGGHLERRRGVDAAGGERRKTELLLLERTRGQGDDAQPQRNPKSSYAACFHEAKLYADPRAPPTALRGLGEGSAEEKRPASTECGC